jgi:hypothetical protein
MSRNLFHRGLPHFAHLAGTFSVSQVCAHLSQMHVKTERSVVTNPMQATV